MTKSAKTASLIIGGGLLAGTVNGLLGTGGGIILVFLLAYLLKGQNADSRDVYANVIAVVLPLSAVSLILYLVRGMVESVGFGIYIFPAIIGGVLGGLLLQRINTTLLKKAFAILVIYSGISMILK